MLFILGLNQNNEISVIPNIKSLFKTPHQAAYKFSARTKIMNWASVDDIEIL